MPQLKNTISGIKILGLKKSESTAEMATATGFAVTAIATGSARTATVTGFAITIYFAYRTIIIVIGTNFVTTTTVGKTTAATVVTIIETKMANLRLAFTLGNELITLTIPEKTTPT